MATDQWFGENPIFVTTFLNEDWLMDRFFFPNYNRTKGRTRKHVSSQVQSTTVSRAKVRGNMTEIQCAPDQVSPRFEICFMDT